MRKSSVILVPLLVALAAPARAQDVAMPAARPSERRIEIGLSVLPMALGKFIATNSANQMITTSDAAFSYGLGLQVGYVLLPGLTVGVAPQVFLNVKPKEETAFTAQEIDLMARVAYAVRPVSTIALYAEALPGYSLIHPSSGSISKGVVLGLGVGAAADMSDRTFVSLGAGYQVGFQKVPALGETKTRYLRVALGVGMRF
jgi:hypothetical protein